MEQYYNTPKKPSGCLAVAGWFMLVTAALMVAFGIFYWVYDDKEWTRKQDMEGKMLAEWEQENGDYMDFIIRLDSLSGDAFLRGDRSAVLAYEDSICNYALEKVFSDTDGEFADADEDFSAADARDELMRLDSLLKQSVRTDSGDAVANYCDSIREQAISMGPSMPARKYLGFPLGGLLSVIVFILAVPPFLLGIILLVVYYSKRSTYKAQLRSSVPPPPPSGTI